MTRRVKIIRKRDVFKKFIFRIEEVNLSHEMYDGTMSKELVRLSLDRGDSVAVVLHDTQNNLLLFTEQFRYATYDKGPGWILEIPAGMIKKNEAPDKAMKRELEEETGFSVKQLYSIGRFYVSPGGTSEMIYLFYAGITPDDQTSAGGGVALEGEDIKTVSLGMTEVERRIDAGEFEDAKTLVGLQWFLMNRHKLVSLHNLADGQTPDAQQP
jgi:ADP-ribose pyrophosphatase